MRALGLLIFEEEETVEEARNPSENQKHPPLAKDSGGVQGHEHV